MSFFKKMKDKFEDLIGDDDDKKPKEEKDKTEHHGGMHHICTSFLQGHHPHHVGAISTTNLAHPQKQRT